VDAHDVEGDAQPGQIGAPRKPERCGSPEAPLLFTADHLDGIAEVKSRAHLDLAEDHLAAAPDDEVDLAATDASVRGDDPVAACAVVETRASLGRLAGR
jgi:hypothetical protein